MQNSIWGLVLSIFFSQTVTANMIWGPIHTTTWQNPTCQSLKTCELQEFNMRQQDWKADYSKMYPEEAAKLGEPLYNYGTTVFYEYKTDRAELLENYTMVSFIKGCMYKSKRNPDATIENMHMFARDLLGKLALYLHRDWQVDSMDVDPMYKNEFAEVLAQNPSASRHGRWEWTVDPLSFDQNASTDFRKKKPPTGRLFTSDRPGTAFRMNLEESKNVSLKVRACLYPTGQVPNKISFANETDFGQPLMCHEWSHSKIFNHSTAKFETQPDVTPVCEGEPLSTTSFTQEGGAYFY